MFDEDEIKLDKETFRVLSSGTRIDILKMLQIRRFTLTEMSKRLGMSPSSVKEHLDSMCSAGLIAQVDEGRKWKYYTLTRKGRSIVDPVEKKVLIVLAISVVTAISGIVSIYPSRNLPEAALGIASDSIQSSGTIPWNEIAIIAVSFLVIGICIGYIYRKSRINQ